MEARRAGRCAAPLLLLVQVTCTIPSDSPETGPSLSEGDSPVELIGAGDIASCREDYRDEATAALVQQHPDALVFTAGDNAYVNGSAADYACYHASWGAFKDRTRPVPGNHEYHLPTEETSVAQDYFDYFNGIGVESGAAGPRSVGYYAYDYGAWRIYALNSEINTSSTSPQVAWLKQDLAANPRTCILALWHKPFYTSGANHAPQASIKPIWEALNAAGAEVAISGHNHHYERFAPQNSAGVVNAAGMRQFVVGTGGTPTRYQFVDPLKPNSEAQGMDWGVIKFTLYPARYEWVFIPIEGGTFVDSGSAECSPLGAAPPVPPEPPPPPPPLPSAITLVVSGRADATKHYMTLDWTGAAGSSVDVWRNGSFLANTLNDGHYGNSRTFQGSATYTYKVCEQGTAVCSSPVTVQVGGTSPAPPPPPPPPPPAISLTVAGRTDATKQYMTLRWSGAAGANVDVYRNGPRIATTANDGYYVNSRSFLGAISYTYKVCQAGSTVCSNQATVTFK